MRIRTQEGDDIVIYMNDMPKEYVAQYTAGAANVIGDRIKRTDSKKKGHEFEALHCSVVYRYGDSVSMLGRFTLHSDTRCFHSSQKKTCLLWRRISNI